MTRPSHSWLEIVLQLLYFSSELKPKYVVIINIIFLDTDRIVEQLMFRRVSAYRLTRRSMQEAFAHKGIK